MEKGKRRLKSTADDFLLSAAELPFPSQKTRLKALVYALDSTSNDVVSSLPFSLHRFISRSINQFKGACAISPVTPASKRVRKSERRPKTRGKDEASAKLDQQAKLEKVSEKIQIYVHVACLCVSHPKNVFSASDLLPAVKELHDNLVRFELVPKLLSDVASLCEQWWKTELPGRDCLITQSLPFIVSQSLTLDKKSIIRRVYALREAFTLFDFEDESIQDLKSLLIRCLISPLYYQMDEGKKFLAFLFGLSIEFLRHFLAVIRCQIPFGKKSMLDAYGEIVFRAWKAAEGESREEIENGFLRALVDSSIHASTASFAASIRRILRGFIIQITYGGVEKLIYNLTDPIIFRSLQVANSNVRKNALHLLIEVFPLQDPDLKRVPNHELLLQQFKLIQKLIIDDCPDIRALAVEGVCRILYLFWQIVPTLTITKLLTQLLDNMAHDVSNMVKLSTVNGIIYLLKNPLSHDILKVILPRLGHLILDLSLSIRNATVDLLLLLQHKFDFSMVEKVVNRDVLLSTLANDQPLVAQNITKLLLPSYFPATEDVNTEEVNIALVDGACELCTEFIKDSPLAGARFCEFLFSEGAASHHLATLFKHLIKSVLLPDNTPPDQIEGMLMAAANICNNLVTKPRYEALLKGELTGEKLMGLFSAAKTSHAQTSVFKIVLTVLPGDAGVLREKSMAMVTKCVGLSDNKERQEQMRVLHNMMMLCGWFPDMIDTLTRILQKTAEKCISKNKTSLGKKRKVKHGAKDSIKSKHMSQKKHSDAGKTSLYEDYTVCVGVAWQLRDLLTDINTRKAVLGSRGLGSAFHALKVISEFAIESLQCDHIDTFPVSAYTWLSLHMSVKDSTVSTEHTVEHLLNCTEKVYKTNATSKSSKDSGSSFRDEKWISDIVKLSTRILMFIVKSNTIKQHTNNHQETCLRFTRQYLGFVILNLRKHSSEILEFREEDRNETFLCLKSSFTYSAKLLNLVLTSYSESTPHSTEVHNLSNDIFDFIIAIEEHMGSRYGVRLFSVVKEWLPDLILSLDSSQTQPAAAPPTWVVILAKIELVEVCADKDPSKFCMFKKVIESMVKLLRGKRSVLDVVGAFLLNSLERIESGLVSGILHFVCGKMVKETGEWGDMKLMLECVGRIYPSMERMLEEVGDEGEKEQLERGRTLLEPIWKCYVDVGPKEPVETGFEDS